MKRSDMTLIGIVAGIVILVVAAVVVTLSRPEPTYQADDTPAGVAHNYLLAVQKDDYERAYSYLSPNLPGYPETLGDFIRSLDQDRWRFRRDTDVSLTVESTEIIAQEAIVEVRESRFYGGGLFDSGQSSNIFELQLEQVAGTWRVVGGDYYFAWCWENDEGCR